MCLIEISRVYQVDGYKLVLIDKRVCSFRNTFLIFQQICNGYHARSLTRTSSTFKGEDIVVVINIIMYKLCIVFIFILLLILLSLLQLQFS